MSLREEMRQYEKITGESAEHVPIIKLGAFLDGYDMGIKALEQGPILDKIRSEIEQAADKQFQIAMGVSDLNERYAHIQMENAYRHSLNVIDKYKAESEDKECR